MTKRASIAKNAFSLFTARAIGCLLTVAFVAILSRSLDDTGFGIYTFALSTGAILSVIADFGFLHLIPREVARDKNLFDTYIATGCVIKILFSITVFIAMIVFLRFFYPPTVRYAVYAAFAMATFRGMVDFCASFFNAFERMHYSAYLLIFCSIVIFASGTGSILSGVTDAWTILLIQAAAMAVLVGISFLVVFKVLRPQNLRVNAQLCFKTLRKAVPFGLFTIGGIIYFQVDNILLATSRGMEEVGFYQGAMRLIMAIEMLPLVLSLAIYPTISRVLKDSKEGAIIITQKMMFLVLIIGPPIGLTLMILAKPIVHILFGDGHFAIASALVIVAWIVPIRFCGNVLGTALSASGNQKFRTLASWIAVVLNVVLNLILLPKYGYKGAAITSVITNFFLISFYYITLCFCFHRFEVFVTTAKIAIPMAGLLVILQMTDHLNVFLCAGAGLALYCVLLVPFGLVPKAQAALLKSFISYRSKG